MGQVAHLRAILRLPHGCLFEKGIVIQRRTAAFDALDVRVKRDPSADLFLVQRRLGADVARGVRMQVQDEYRKNNDYECSPFVFHDNLRNQVLAPNVPYIL